MLVYFLSSDITILFCHVCKLLVPLTVLSIIQIITMALMAGQQMKNRDESMWK
jgi:hypothetical protein